tara:strand:+ start:1401 stop:2654 length:1254 start_codon:yes stop_codon:yes gene_type:complete
MIELAKKLWPLNRSLTGKGNLETLKIIKKYNPHLKIKKFKSGTKVFDWKIPNEWKVNKAYILTPDGKKICDFKKNNLHLLGYSKKVKKKIDLKKLKKNLFFIKKKPHAIPYLTSYYKKRWGFCISYNNYKKLIPGKYHVNISSSFKKGFMHYGEIYIPGKSKLEVTFSTYICHPSLANNELSGPVLLTFLAKFISQKKRNYSYRIIFAPETIGTISYISKNLENLKKFCIAGYVVTCVGDNRSYSYIPSRKGNTISDEVALKIFSNLNGKKKKYTWLDRKSDERQFCSPNVDLPFCSLIRTKYHSYPEYHTSEDKIGSVMNANGLSTSLKMYKNIIQEFEKKIILKSKFLCEPFMTKYNLYPTIRLDRKKNYAQSIMDFLSLSDGTISLDQIFKKIKISKKKSYEIYKLLKKKSLIY